MSQESSFTDEERAIWYRARRLGLGSTDGYTSEELDEIEEEQKATEGLGDREG